MFYIYILYSKNFDRYYVGSTENVESRLIRHNSKMVTSTKKYIPWLVVYTEQFLTRAEAVNREDQIKKMKSRKYIEALISNKHNP
jgi:putative endonuclease